MVLGPLETILAVTDLSPGSFGAVEQAVRLAGCSGARLLLVHVIDDDVDEEHVAHALLRLARRFGRCGVCIECRVAHGRPREEITRLAREVAAQLIVLAQARCYLGSAVETVLCEAAVPVLVAPRTEPATVTARR
jgi:nucleotide-binding universal stress UspA family protein